MTRDIEQKSKIVDILTHNISNFRLRADFTMLNFFLVLRG